MLCPDFFVDELTDIVKCDGQNHQESEKANSVVEIENLKNRIDPCTGYKLHDIHPSDVDQGKNRNSEQFCFATWIMMIMKEKFNNHEGKHVGV